MTFPSPARWIAALLVLGAAAGSAFATTSALLPEDGTLARGLRVAGEPVLEGQSARAVAEDRAERALSRKVTFRWGDRTAVTTTLRDLDAEIDTESLARNLDEIAREGDALGQLHDAWEARAGRVDVRVPVRIGADKLSSLLTRFKEENDTPPVSARLRHADHTATDDAPGRYVDVYAAMNALDRAIAAAPQGDLTVDLPAFSIAPRASKATVLALDVSQVISRFETKFGYVGGQQNRAGNITRASSQVDGLVLMPGEIVSFNERVGPRSLDNGFFTAPEIYKGEMREGIGGGTCQVAGTLHAAAFFGGLEIVERSPHSRPSGYIRMGLDATVVYPTTDLKLKNPYDFPVVVRATIVKGTLAFELLGPKKPVTVDLTTDTVSSTKFKRKIEEVSWFPEGKFVLKQKGIVGHTIKKTRVMHFLDGTSRSEVTTDVYPATFEIYQVAPGTDLGALPPPPEEEGAPPPPASTAPPGPPQAQAPAASPTSG